MWAGKIVISLSIAFKVKRKSETPSIELKVIAYGLNVKTLTSKRVINIYDSIIERVGSEVSLWLKPSKEVENSLSDFLEEGVLRTILAVHKGEFTFDPPGFDGEYGKLKIFHS